MELDLVELRARAEKGEGLCLGEHEAFRSDDGRILGMRCDGVELDTYDLGPDHRLDRSDEIPTFFTRTLQVHERKVIAAIVVELIDRLEQANAPAP